MDIASLVVVSFSVMWAFSFLIGEKTEIGLVLTCISVVYSMSYFFLLRKINLLFSGHFLMGLLLVGVTISNFYTGGLTGSNDVAFIAIPVLSLFLLGVQGLLWSMVCAGVISVFIGLLYSGYEFTQVIPESGVLFDSSLTLFSFIVLISVIAYLYEKERIRAEKDILEAKVRAEDASKAKSRFLANMSHELRTPLNAVIGLTDITLGGDLQDPHRKNLEAVKASARQLLSLVDDVLDLSSLESGSMTIVQAPFCPAEFLDELCKPFMARAKDIHLEFKLSIDDAVPDRLMGDALRIRQVLLNILDNSLKFTKQGYVELRVNWQDGVLKIEVEDTGIGIAESVQQQVFRPFSKPELLLSRHTNGAGLGLALCRELLGMMNGKIRLSSTLEKGSCFSVEIPAERVAMMVPGHKYHLLAAEDDRVGQELLRTVLCTAEYDVCVVSNGQEALDEVESGDYDLVLMDIQMPYMDGLEATRLIRQRYDSKIPILALTAHALAEEKEKCFDAGMDDFIAKPIEPDALLTLIGSWICKRHPG